MEEQDIKLPEPIHVKNIHHKLDIFSENNIIKEWGGYAIVDTFFYLYLFNKYKHNCLLKNNSLTNTSLGLELQIKEKKNISSEELNISEKHMIQIAIQLSKCIKKGLPNIIIPLYLKFASNTGHANLLIYRQKNNVIEHFEPYGSQYGKNAGRIKFINKKLDDFISILNKELPQQSQVKLIRANDVCPMFDGFQTLEEKSTIPKLEIQGKGYCTAWSMFFTELSLKNPNYSSNELINIIYDKLNKLSENDRNSYLRKIVVGYVNLIDNKIEKYFSIVFGKQITSETISQIIKQRKDGLLLSSMKTIVDIETALLNDPSLTKDDYLQYIKIKIKNTKNITEKNNLMAQEKMLQNIDILLNASPISEQYKSPSKKISTSISSIHLSSLSSSKSPSKSKSISKSSSKKKSSSISSVHLSSLSSSKSPSKSKSISKSSSKSKSPSKKTSSSISSVHLSSLSPSKSSSKSSPKNITQKSKSSLTNSISSLKDSISSLKNSVNTIEDVSVSINSSSKKDDSSLKDSISSLKKSVNTIEDVSFSIDLTSKTNSSSKKDDSSLKKSISSLKDSISSLKKSVNTIEVEFSIDLTSKTKSSSKKDDSSLKNSLGSLKSSISSLTDSLYSLEDKNPESFSAKSSSNEKKINCDDKKLKPCSEIQLRNPITCRCNKIKTGCENKKLKPCSAEIQVRNLITCRCNKLNNTRKRKICQPEKFKPCTNNRVRNSVTCRCRKIKV